MAPFPDTARLTTQRAATTALPRRNNLHIVKTVLMETIEFYRSCAVEAVKMGKITVSCPEIRKPNTLQARPQEVGQF
jgi:hypothetical protein